MKDALELFTGQAMTENWPEGYFVNIPYTKGYYREMAPAYLRFCLLLKGVLPPDAANFNYCELAMGHGYSANIHAAANDGIFVGLDFMPDHALFAERMAKGAATGLQVRDAGIAEFCSGSTDEFDYVCLHGGWSWIAGHNREIIVNFLGRCLKPGGVFYVSYNTWPGWFSAAPLRKLFTLFDNYYGSAGMPETERIGNAVTLTEALLDCNPLFLNASEWIRERFDGLKKENPAYLAHEFFNADWNVEWSSDVAKQLWRAKLSFGASAAVCDNIDGFGFTEDAGRFLSSIANPLLREQVRDFFCNTQFRADIFIKGIIQLVPEEQIELLAQEYFILSKLPDDMQYVIVCGMGVYELDKTLHGKLVQAMAADNFSAKTLRALQEKVADMADLRQTAHAMARLIAKGYAQPCKPLNSKKESCSRLNALIMSMPENCGLEFLASPVSGSAVEIPPENIRAIRDEFNGKVPISQKTGFSELLMAHGIINH